MLKEQNFYVTVYKLLQELFFNLVTNLYFFNNYFQRTHINITSENLFFFFIYEILCTILDPLFDIISFIFIFMIIENRNGVNKLTNLLNFY